MTCPVCGRRECGCLIDDSVVGPEGVRAYLRAVDDVPRGPRCAASLCRTRVGWAGAFCPKHRPTWTEDAGLASLSGMFHKGE